MKFLRVAMVVLAVLQPACRRFRHALSLDPAQDPGVADESLRGPRMDVPSRALTQKLVWRLTGQPRSTITMAERSEFVLEFDATNTGTTVVDVGFDGIHVTVNGQGSNLLDDAITADGRSSSWRMLNPGETVCDRRFVGELMFPAPGTYEVTLAHHGWLVARTTVRVAP